MTTETTMPPATTAEAKDGGGVVLQRLVGRLGSTAELYNADCADVIGRLATVDAVITDPPYGIGSWSATGGNSITQEQADEINEWDCAVPEKVLREAISLGKVAVVWGGNYLMDVLGKCRAPLVWDKAIRGMHFADGEMAWTNFDWGTLRILNFPLASGDTKGKKKHPTQKPLRVMAWALQQAGEVKTLLDPWMGSGTSLVAAKLAGVRAIGIEVNEEYCKLAVARLAQGVLWPANDQAQRP